MEQPFRIARTVKLASVTRMVVREWKSNGFCICYVHPRTIHSRLDLTDWMQPVFPRLQQLCLWLMLDSIFEVLRKVLVRLVERNVGFWEQHIEENAKPEIKKRIRPLCAYLFDGPHRPCPQRGLLSQSCDNSSRKRIR